MSDFYCEHDVEVAEMKKCSKQCAMCLSLEDTARALVEEYVPPASIAANMSESG